MRVKKTTQDHIFSRQIWDTNNRVAYLSGKIVMEASLEALQDIKSVLIFDMLALQIWDVKNREQKKEVKKLLAKYDEMLTEIIKKECGK